MDRPGHPAGGGSHKEPPAAPVRTSTSSPSPATLYPPGANPSPRPPQFIIPVSRPSLYSTPRQQAPPVGRPPLRPPILGQQAPRGMPPPYPPGTADTARQQAPPVSRPSLYSSMPRQQASPVGRPPLRPSIPIQQAPRDLPPPPPPSTASLATPTGRFSVPTIP